MKAGIVTAIDADGPTASSINPAVNPFGTEYVKADAPKFAVPVAPVVKSTPAHAKYVPDSPEYVAPVPTAGFLPSIHVPL